MPQKYRAFISYSRSDSDFAKRLHQYLEDFRIPPGLQTKNDDQSADTRLRPIFIDTAELPAARNLGEALKESLNNSEALIVVASPASAKSHWVQEEILHFRTDQGTAPVLPIIVAGRPDEDNADIDCFSPALRFRVEAGAVTTTRDEPLAADVSADGEQTSFLRIVAGLLGVSLGELSDRHAEATAKETKRKRRAIAKAYAHPARSAFDADDYERCAKLLVASAIESDDPEWVEAPEIRRLLRDVIYAPKASAIHRGGAASSRYAASADRSRIFTGFSDGIGAYWDIAKQRGIAAVKVPGEEWTAVAFDPLERFFVIGTAGGRLEFLDYHTGDPQGSLRAHQGRVTSIALSPTGNFIASTASGTTFSRGAFVASNATPNEEKIAAVGSADGIVHILSGHERAVLSGDFSADGSLFATASYDGTARVWDSRTGEQRLVLSGHAGAVRRAVFAASDALVITISDDRTCRTWDARDGTQLAQFTGHTDKVARLAISSDGLWAVTSSAETAYQDMYYLRPGEGSTMRVHDSVARVWDVRSGKERLNLDGHPGEVRDVCISPNDEFIATGCTDGLLRLWRQDWRYSNEKTISPLYVLRGHRADIERVWFDAPGTNLISTSKDGEVHVWPAYPGRKINRIGSDHQAKCIAFSRDAKRLAVVGYDHHLTVVDVETPLAYEQVEKVDRGIENVAFIGTNDSVLTFSRIGRISAWSVGEGMNHFERQPLRRRAAPVLE